MNGGMIGETPYDVRWRMFGIPVRVHPLFWVMAALISWDSLRYGLPHVLLSVLCIFVSILIHEMGHVFAGRWFGSDGHIVLWAFGGLAFGSNRLDRRGQRIFVSFAGPLAQFLLFGLIVLILVWLPKQPEDRFILLIPFIPDSARGPFNSYVVTMAATLLYVNLYWAVLNLLPIWPLDGGQISRELFVMQSPRDGIRLSLHLSMATAALLALHALIADQSGGGIPYLPTGTRIAIFFGIFVFFGYQALQVENSRDRWDDDRWR